MAHTDLCLLNRLLECIDDDRNTIYLHIDKKADFDLSNIYAPQNAKCLFIPRRRVSWGGDSMISVEMDLLEAAFAEGFDYYHLLSGQDLPIKSQSYIHNYFDSTSNNYNYIEICNEANISEKISHRLGRYHFLQDSIGRNSGKRFRLLRIIERKSLSVQKRLRINRITKIPFRIYKGSEWFSINHEMVKYVISQKKAIKRWFMKGLCADELFIQTVAMTSSIKDSIVSSSLREIDWERGGPYTFRKEDYPMLIKSDDLFARKFSTDIDAEIIDMICEKVLMDKSAI